MRLFAWPGSVTRGGLINDELAGSDVVGSAERRGRSSGGGSSSSSSSQGSQGIGRSGARSGEHRGETIRLACTSSIRQTSCCVSMSARNPVMSPRVPLFVRHCWPLTVGNGVANVVKRPWSLWTRPRARVSSATRATRGRGGGATGARREGREGRARVSAASNASPHGQCKTAALPPPRIPAILSRISPSRGSMSRSSSTMRPPLSWCRPVSGPTSSRFSFLFFRIFQRTRV